MFLRGQKRPQDLLLRLTFESKTLPSLDWSWYLMNSVWFSLFEVQKGMGKCNALFCQMHENFLPPYTIQCLLFRASVTSEESLLVFQTTAFQHKIDCFLAHLCLCTVGSYTSLSVCPSDVTWPKLKTRKKFICLSASCKSTKHWQVGSLQCQVAFFVFVIVKWITKILII